MDASSYSPHMGMSTSISSLGSSVSSARYNPSSSISKTYRQSSTLFLTRRLPEALSTVLPLITPPQSDHPDGAFEPAPVARASRTTRIKVWSLYLTIMNAILELDSDEGKDAFGTQEWRALCAKVRDGEVWDEVIRNGYHGVEGDVDSEVVINLATLLLTHAKNQLVNQKHLENYLAAARTPNLDISDRFNQSQSTPKHLRSQSKGAASGADTPRDLNARVKILELYTLHALPRNNEWEYAREFISMSAVLDDERREAFLQALQSLQEEQHEAEKREHEERQRREDAIRRDVEEARRLRAENEERERKRLEEERRDRKRREEGGSEVDYGIEKTPGASGSSSLRGGNNNAKRTGTPRPTAPRKAGKAIPKTPSNPSSSQSTSLATRASMVFTNIKTLVEQFSLRFQTNPFVLYRTLAFIITLLLMLSRRSIREKISRILGGSWDKVKATAGMGVKVSYI